MDAKTNEATGEQALSPKPEDQLKTDRPYPEEWSTWTKRFITVVLVIVGIWSLNFLTPILTILILSFLLTFLLFVPTIALTRRTRLSYEAAAILVYIVYLLLLVVFSLSLLPDIIEAVNNLVVDVRIGLENLAQFLLNYTPEQGLVMIVGQQFDLNFVFEPLSNSVQEIVNSLGEVPSTESLGTLFSGVLTATQVVSGAIGGLGGILTDLFIVHLATLLFLLEIPRWYASLYEIRSRALRREYLIIVQRVYRVWIQFFEVQVITGIIIGVVTWLQFVLMGIPSAVFMGVFTGLTSLIPNVGGFFALVPMGLIPLFQGSSVLEFSNITVALLAVAINFGIQMVFWNVFVPKMTSDALELSLPVVILGVFIGAALGGILGAFLVVPFIGSIRVIVIYVLRKLRGGDPYPGEDEPDHWTQALLRYQPKALQAQDQQIAKNSG